MKLHLARFWARLKMALPWLLAAVVGLFAASKMRKSAPVNRSEQARTDKILADAVRPHVAARVEAAKAQARAQVESAKAAHDKALSDAARVHTATPGELDALLKAYAKKARKAAQLLALGWALSAGAAQAQEPQCDETQCVLPIDVARSLLADAAQVDGLHLEVAALTLANTRLDEALTAQGIAAEVDAKALRSLAVSLEASQAREMELRTKAARWHRRPWFLISVGLVLGVAASVAVAL